MRARLRLLRQLAYASDGQRARAAEEGRGADAALIEARKQQAGFDAPSGIGQVKVKGVRFHMEANPFLYPHIDCADDLLNQLW